MQSRPSKCKTTIAIKGGYGYGNFGDDALMFAAYEIVKKICPPEEIVFICKDSNYIKGIVPIARVVSPNSADARNAHTLVYGGGTQFYSFPLTSKRGLGRGFGRIWRNARRPFQLVQKMFKKSVESSHFPSNAKIAAIGIGIGPFVEKCKRERWTQKLFVHMDYIALRDIQSYELCKQWGCKNISFSSDLCYLPELWQTQASDRQIDDGIHKVKKVGIIIRDWPHTREGDSYSAPLFEVVDQLRAEGKDVEFISFALASDKVWTERLEKQHEHLITWDPERFSIPEFMRSLSCYDIFLSARYHGAVFASLLGKPVVCIGVEQKLEIVAGLFEDGARLWSYPFSVPECISMISDIENKYSVTVACMNKVVKEQKGITEKMVAEFRVSIEGDSRMPV